MFAALSLACVSCNDREADSGFMNFPISFCVQTDGVDTRATRYGSETEFAGQSFGIYGWDEASNSIYSNSTVSKTDGKWLAGGTTQYWEKDKSYTFEAIYPRITGTPTDGLTSFTPNTVPGSVTFSYKVPSSTASANSKDIMLAYYSGTGVQDGEFRAANLTFTHPLTCVCFKSGNMNGVTNVTEISLNGVYQQATCSVRTITDSSSRQCYSYENDLNVSLWNTTDAAKTTVTGTQTVTPANLTVGVAAYNFLLIPQSVSSSAPVKVTVKYTVSGESMSQEVSVPDISWKAGYYYTYELNFDGYIMTVNPVTVAAWGTENIDVQLN